jgi:site-specific DNA-methyltransferase (adenine-specific)
MKHLSETFNRDCVEAMKEYSDNYWDLAVVDPPYGLGKRLSDGGGKLKNTPMAELYREKDWDVLPNYEYWQELFRVSKNQVVFGANYFLDHLPSTRGFVCWDKNQAMPTLSACELVWTSFDKPAKIMSKSSTDLDRFHPTQKPIYVYEWMFDYCKVKQSIRCGNKHTKEYNHLCDVCKTPFRVLDTHLGSQSSRIAAYKAGLDFTGFELDKEYFEQGNKRFNDFLTVYEQEVGKEKILNNQTRLF